MTRLWTWAPAVIFGLGSLLIMGVDRQSHLEIEGDLAAAVPTEVLGKGSRDLDIAQAEMEVAGMDSYLLRSYEVNGESAAPDFSLYVGYYGSQAQGRTIHSPKNCLPGGGWEVLNSRQATVATAAGAVPVNRYLLKRDDEQVLVLYWYQGRGRVQANEYLVKLDLLRDSALRGRSDEALVRIVVPITTSEDAAFETASRIAAEIVPAVYTVLPA